MRPGILHGSAAAAGGGGGGGGGASSSSSSATAPTGADPAAAACAPDSGATRPTTISWNEGVIAEHDKERGTRRKILEPKTPYRAPSAAAPAAAAGGGGGGGGGPPSREYGSAASVCSVVSEEDGMNQVPPDQLAAALQSAWDAASETGSACA